MLLGGLALVFSRLIDNGVIVLENIFRHMEIGETTYVAAEKGGNEVSMAVLAATFTTAIVFFPVTFIQRRKQIHFYAACAGRRALDLRLVFLRDDGGAALLRQVRPARSSGMEHEGEIEAVQGAKPDVFKRFVLRFNSHFRRFLELV